MAANTSPIFTATPRVGFGTLTGNIGLTRSDGVGTVATDHFKCFTAGSNGSIVNRIRINPAASASTSMTASCIRFYISTISSGSTTAADTVLFAELSVAALAAAHTTNANLFYEIPCGFTLPTGYYIHASIDDNLAANTRWQILVFGGDF